jgi:tripartite-type tricarboxylate transporter receptor subunit TctC
MHRRLAACSLAALVASFTSAALAQRADDRYPERPVTIVMPLPPGGGIDAELRLYVPHLSEKFGRQFVVEYKPGASGAIANGSVAKAPADGYTLLTVTAGFTITAATQARAAYHPVDDFAPISLLSKTPNVLVAKPAFPARTLAEYIAYARANPGKVNFGAAGQGGVQHLLGAWLHSATGTEVTFVQYKGGNPVTVALLAGEVDVSALAPASAVPQVQSGKLRALGVATLERSKLLPGVPTIAETAVAGFDVSNWFGFSAPAGTPPAIVGKLNAALREIVHRPDVVQRLEATGALPIGSSPDELRRLIAAEIPRWRAVIARAGIRVAD